MPIFRLVADVSSDDPERIRPVIGRLLPTGVTATADGFHVEIELTGESARELNRDCLDASHALAQISQTGPFRRLFGRLRHLFSR